MPIELSKDEADALSEAAERLGVSPEELASAALSDALDHSKQDFLKAAEYVLKKNEELLRRLGRRPT